VARALVRAHEAGIVHRDLKPDNIFLIRNEDEEIAKVLDFGIAKSKAHAIGADTATRTGSVLGTPYYMSPEQISGSKELDSRTDLWALAVIAYEMLTGRRPYTADTVGGLAIEICTRRPPPPSSHAPVPIGFDAWFDRATSVDPAQRFGTARELAEDLRRVCGTSSGRMSGPGDSGTRVVPATSARSLDALSSTTHPHGDSRAGKHVWKWAALAGVIIVSGLGAASWLTSSNETSAPAVLSSPVEPKPAEAKPVEPKPAEPKPAEAKPVETQAPIAPAAAAPAAVTPLPTEAPVDMAQPLTAEVKPVDPPAKIDVTKTAPKGREDPPRKAAKPKPPVASTATRGASPPPAVAPSRADVPPENRSILDDRK
ncbi:MAG: protein kinase, partial [Polyangiaceae bacterium]